MKFSLCVLAVAGLALVNADSGSSNSESPLSECGSKFADKIQALCGNFLAKEEIVDVSFFSVI